MAYSRSIRKDLKLVSDGVDSERTPSFLEWRLSASTVTCEPIYGFLPCSTNVWGLLFLIVVYEILLSLGGISALSGSTAAAQQRAKLGMGLVAGTTVMLLTLIWGSVVVLGSYDLSQANTTDSSGNQKKTTIRGYGVVTDVETSYTARIILITLFPLLILQLATIFHSSSVKRVIILIVLIITVVLLAAYIFYQTFQPWIQNRRFEYLMSKYAKDKLMRLISRNGKPDTRKIQELVLVSSSFSVKSWKRCFFIDTSYVLEFSLWIDIFFLHIYHLTGCFNKINKNNDASISTAELRVLLLGVHMDDDDSSTDRNVETIMASLDTSADGRINQDEFIKGMTKLVSDISNQTPVSNSQNTNQAMQGLLTSSTQTSQTSNSWLNYLRAAFFLTVGTVMLCAFAEPLIRTVVDFAQAANLSSFSVSYLAIPFAMNYGVAVQSISSARQKTQKSISLTLSAIYGGVYMNNVIGLIVFLAPVYARNLAADASAEVLVVLIICIVMSIFTSFCTIFPRWTGYLVLVLYPTSLASVYILTSVFGWS
ncbi:UNVERIFIED_CONTAM: Sodium/calcium exchanger NCL2 [Sesamum radiatum]|uniref:Sodium/calcium exchanger NCL2 n=1 Tax=Sesamum radiatum TaxID=300843 RepID=A0AAW2K2X4_SESRA